MGAQQLLVHKPTKTMADGAYAISYNVKKGADLNRMPRNGRESDQEWANGFVCLKAAHP
jgi:hypothetical protein